MAIKFQQVYFYKNSSVHINMVNIKLEGNFEGELKNTEYENMINQLRERSMVLQNEIEILLKQKCDLTNQLKVLTEENRVLQNEIPQLHNEKLELTNQLKVIKNITDRY